MSSGRTRALQKRLAELRILQRRVAAEVLAVQLELDRRKRGLRRTELEHGTDSGYLWHHRHRIPFPEDRGGEACGCREAHALRVAVARLKRVM